MGHMGVIRECEGADRVLSNGLNRRFDLPFTHSSPFTRRLLSGTHSASFAHRIPFTASDALGRRRSLSTNDQARVKFASVIESKVT